MAQEKILEISRNETKKDGTKYYSEQFKRNYFRVGVKTDKRPETMYCNDVFDKTKDWKVGDIVELEYEAKPDAQGKVWHNFNLPKKEDVKLAQLENKLEEKIVHKLESILIQLGQIKHKLDIKSTTPSNEEEKAKGYHYPTPEEEGIKVEKEVEYPEEISADEIPF